MSSTDDDLFLQCRYHRIFGVKALLCCPPCVFRIHTENLQSNHPTSTSTTKTMSSQQQQVVKEFKNIENQSAFGEQICYFHNKFGREAKKCRMPCSYRKRMTSSQVAAKPSQSTLSSLPSTTKRISSATSSSDDTKTNVHLICHFHEEYGVKVRYCRPPCKFTQPNSIIFP